MLEHYGHGAISFICTQCPGDWRLESYTGTSGTWARQQSYKISSFFLLLDKIQVKLKRSNDLLHLYYNKNFSCKGFIFHIQSFFQLLSRPGEHLIFPSTEHQLFNFISDYFSVFQLRLIFTSLRALLW